MANYNVDIAVAIKNARALKALNKDIKVTSNIIDDTNAKLRQNANAFEANFNRLNKSVREARKNLNEAAIGTKAFEKAGSELLQTQKALNIALKEEARILKEIETRRFGVAQSSSGNRVRRNVAESRRSRISSKFKTLDTPTPDKLGQVAIRTNVLRNIRESQESRIGEGFRSLSLSGQSVDVEAKIKQTLENRRRTEKEVAQIRERLIKKEEKLNATRRKILKEEITTRTRILRQNQFGNVNPGMGGFRAFSQNPLTPIDDASAYSSPIGPMPMRRSAMDRLRGKFSTGGAFAATRGQRFRGAASNALIGGGFPFLFGQGPIGAIGGGLGGALGGALGGGFGFGLSIAGTAIAQQIQQTLDFRKSIRELNKEMQQMGISSNISGSQVRQLGKSLGITKEEAVKALQEFKRFGDNAVLFAEKFGGDFAKFDAIAQANTVQSALAAIRKINKDITLDDELRFLNSVRRQGVEATINQMLDEMLEKEKKLETAGFGQGEGKNAGANRKRVGQLRQESKATQDLTDENTVFREELIKVRDQFIQNRDAAEAANRSIASGLEQVNAEIRKLNDAQFQVVELSKTLGSAFSESFKGIIKGTMSVGDAFRNMFMRISDHFLDMAAQMAAASVAKGFLGLFGSAFSFGGGNNDVFAGFNRGPAGGLTMDSFANGGRPPVGRASLVGERGPELFVPNSAGTIIPNHALGGSTNIVVNVDASGSNLEGDENEGRALGIALSAAIETELIKQKRPGGLLA